MAVQPGQRFDRYAIEELVGEGGMGRVYRAFDTRLERRVALKVLHAAGGDAAESVAIALREARAAAAIAHPNATAVYDAHEIDGTSFIAMEFVAGKSLRAVIQGPPVPLPTRLRWLIDVAAALSAAHKMGVVHRDVKPENVMVRHDGLVKVLDFGVARRIVIEPPSNAAGEPVFHASGARIAGTPAYMAPEQIRGEEIDGRADQFSWGVLAYELLTGKLPWRSAKDLVGYIAAIVGDEPSPPSTLAPEIPAPIDAAILRALSKSAAHRFSTLLSAAAELAPFARASLMMSAAAAPAPGPVEASASPAPPAVATAAPADAAARAPLLSDLDRGPVSSAASTVALGDEASGRVLGELKTAAIDAPSLPEPSTISLPSSSARLGPASPFKRPPGFGGESPSSSSPSPRQLGGRAPVGRESAPSRRAPRRRWPFGSGFHDPDFDAPIDLDAHLAAVPLDATCKGLFMLDALQRASKVVGEAELFRLAQVPERRYVGFRDYPLDESLKLTVASARALFPRYPLGEGLRRAGQAMFDTLLNTHVGRSVFGVFGRDVDLVLLAWPKAHTLLVSAGEITAEKTGYRTFTFHATRVLPFLETFHVGLVEGAVGHCGERCRISIALDDLAAGTIELRLL